MPCTATIHMRMQPASSMPWIVLWPCWRWAWLLVCSCCSRFWYLGCGMTLKTGTQIYI
ncbi:hypothetical protein BDV06DRAFT_194999, partial [Aspergillus oleicola]